MKILVIDRDPLSVQLIRARLEGLGHEVLEEPVKNNALTRLEQEEFGAVILDPSPLNNARRLISSLRRAAKTYLYVILSSQSMSDDEAQRSGANDILPKPADGTRLEQMIENAARLTKIINLIGDDSEDFPNAGGVISRSAFNQIFLSALDRADRYGEKSFLVFISVENHHDILAQEGLQGAQYASAQLSQYLVRLRRQSDIIAQTGKGEYVLMLQRPVYETEPMEAAIRFAEALANIEDIGKGLNVPPVLLVKLLALPTGEKPAEHQITPNKQ